MSDSVKKRGQKFLRKFFRVTSQASEDSKEHIKENLIGRISHVENIRLLVLEWGLLVTALILLAITQSVWFRESYVEEVFAGGGNYTEATIGDVASLNPLFATTNSERVLSKLMFATISEIDYSGHPGMGLAASILPSEDGRVWTMKLRDGLKWSDGRPITNEDVIFTLELIKSPAVNSVYDSSLTNIKITEGDNGEIIFSLPSIYADFVSALNIPVVPKHELDDSDPKNLIEDTFSNAPVTSGAFSFNALQTTATTNEKVYYLSANPHYYKGRPLLNSFAVHTYDNKEAVISALNSGAVTATAELSGADSDKIVAGQFQQKDSSISSGAYVFFNTANPSVKKAELRAAIRQGIDMDKIRAEVPNVTALDHPLLESQIELKDYPEIPERDVAAASAKIAEFTTDGPINIEVATINTGYLPTVANALKAELEQLGLQVHVSTYEENQDFINNVVSKRAYDILVYEIGLGADPDLLPYYHSSQASEAGLNLSNYRNALVDDLLLGARDTLDEELRARKYEAFLEYWVNDVPAIGIYQPNLTYFYNRNVRTYSNNVRLVTALDRFTDVTNWAAVKALKNKTP
ncbi:hypothetical protein IIY66_01910 [Candidatus Saccharibacteria bacterium]|nr:hypothetical protein [Candidatus Saccharibacteria bacterium]